jgi:hypothetical protein
MNALAQDALDTCAEADTLPSPALVLIGSLSPCTWVGFMPDGTLRPNGWEILWAEAHWDNAERDNARLRTRFRYVGTVLVAVALVCLVLGKALAVWL